MLGSLWGWLRGKLGVPDVRAGWDSDQAFYADAHADWRTARQTESDPVGESLNKAPNGWTSGSTKAAEPANLRGTQKSGIARNTDRVFWYADSLGEE